MASDTGRCGETVRQFLLNPQSRKCFDQFFRLCFRCAAGYLRYLQARGYHIVSDQTDQERAIPDLSIDILGGFLQSRPGRSYFVIFDYFERHGIRHFNRTEPDELYSHLTILLRGYIRKELAAIRKHENAQLENLKRRFKDILKDRKFRTLKLQGSASDSIHLQSHTGNLRLDHLPISRQLLTDIVDRAYTASRTRTEWCLNILRQINEHTDHQNVVELNELLAAIVEINSRYIDTDGLRPTGLPTPTESLTRKAIAEAIDHSLNWVESNVLAQFAEKERLTAEESQLFLEASGHYLRDLGENGETDAIPDYFRHVMPKSAHAGYLENHKYLFETVISGAVEKFRERLKKVSIIW